jgi:SAM-dependent methyltransferase
LQPPGIHGTAGSISIGRLGMSMVEQQASAIRPSRAALRRLGGAQYSDPAFAGTAARAAAAWEELLRKPLNGVPLGRLFAADAAAPDGQPVGQPFGPSPAARALAAVEIAVGYCHVCGARGFFLGYDPIDFACKRNSFICQDCGACARNRHVAKCVLERLPTAPASRSLREFAIHFRGRIWQTCTSGAIAEALRGHPGFVASEFIDGAASGDVVNGVRCEDLQAASCADASFDLVMTEDVLEHVAAPRLAFAELGRVLAPGGWHIGTVPVNWSRDVSVPRAVIEDGQVQHILPPEYHGDPTRPAGALAFTEFGRDVVEAWFGLIGPSSMDVAHGDFVQEAAFAIYNSWVFVSRKAGGPTPG